MFRYTLRTDAGMEAEVLTYGGTLRALRMPVDGALRDLVLGYDDVAGYERGESYLGALVVRVANRIGRAHFTLDGEECRLAANSGPNCLHGGLRGFDRKLWEGQEEGGALVLTYTSPAGEEDFPGTLAVRVTYTLGEDGALSIDFRAETDAPTPVSLTNHSYFNLKGEGTVEDHVVEIAADYVSENDGDGLPTGKLLAVGGTPFDLREPRALADGLAQGHAQLSLAGGYDHNFILKSQMDGVLRPAATVEAGGLRMTCLTTQPGLQLYTGNFLHSEADKDGRTHTARSGLCLETQNWPDAVNHSDAPNSILRPGEIYHQRTIYRFQER